MLDDLYSSFYAAARGGVRRGRLDSDADADTDEEGEAREWGNVSKDK